MAPVPVADATGYTLPARTGTKDDPTGNGGTKRGHGAREREGQSSPMLPSASAQDEEKVGGKKGSFYVMDASKTPV
jgi:hypothetical protein